jgi:polyhydroxyalkanoate synthesis regulator phasin
MSKKAMIIGCAAVLVLALGATAAFAAPKLNPDKAGLGLPELCQTWFNKTLEKLGVTKDQYDTASKSAWDDTLADAVKAGTITQEQADQLKQNVPGQGGPGGGFGPMGMMGREGMMGRGRGFGGLMGFRSPDQLAEILGMTADELKAAREQGKTIEDLVTAKGMTMQQFKQQVADKVTADIKAKQADGKITADQATKLLDRVNQWVASDDFLGFGPGR